MGGGANKVGDMEWRGQYLPPQPEAKPGSNNSRLWSTPANTMEESRRRKALVHLHSGILKNGFLIIQNFSYCTDWSF